MMVMLSSPLLWNALSVAIPFGAAFWFVFLTQKREPIHPDICEDRPDGG